MIPLGGAVSKQDKYKAVYSPFDQDKVRSRKRHKITKKFRITKFYEKFSPKTLKLFLEKNSRNFFESFSNFFSEIVNSVNILFFDK